MSNKKQNCAFACDMGGTYIKAACVLPDGSLLEPFIMTASRSDGPLDGILEAWAETFTLLLAQADKAGLSIEGIGVSTPGPFDYKRKMSLMNHKFQAIRGIDLEEAIRGRIPLPDLPFLFVQDANAFLAGEQKFGAAKEVSNCTGVTLGTGLGFAAMADGRFLTNGWDACYIALYRQPWGDGILEDIVSGRGISTAYREATGKELNAKDVGLAAKSGDCNALEVMARLGAALGRGIAFHMIHTYSELLVVGGQISKDFNLFADTLIDALKKDGYTGPVRQAQYPEDAALYGAAGIVFQTQYFSIK